MKKGAASAALIALFLSGLGGFPSPASSTLRRGHNPQSGPDSSDISVPRPLMERRSAGVVRTIGEDFFKYIPARGVDAAIAIQPGVVMQGTDATGKPGFHIRGGRSDEIGYSIEGVPVSEALFGGRGLSVTAEALEFIEVNPGGPGPGVGGGSSGTVAMQMRTGRQDRWSGMLMAETDRFTGMNKRALGGYSYGYSDWTGTIGGPFPGLGKVLRLFGSVQNTFYRDPSVNVRSGWDFSGANAIITDPLLTPAHSGYPARDTINLSFPDGNALGGQDNRWILSGTALLDLSPVTLRLAGSYACERSRTPTLLENVLNQRRLPLNINKDEFFTAKFSHELSPSLSYEASFNYFAKSLVTEDPDLLGNVFAYGDPAANATFGYSLEGASLNWPAYRLWEGAFSVNQPGTQIARYEKDEEASFGGHVGVRVRLGQHELNVGGDFTQYTIRRYAPANLTNWWLWSKQFKDPAVLERALMLSAGGDNYGYDIWGREIAGDDIRNGALYNIGPRKPVFASAFVSDRIDLSDLVLDIGFRFDYIDPDSKDTKEPEFIFRNSDGLLLPGGGAIRRTDATEQVSPRLGFWAPVSDKMMIHGHFGRYVQQSGLIDSYAGGGRMAQTRISDFFTTNLFGWGLKPVRTVQYELGLTRHFNEFATLDITGFYKEINEQVTVTSQHESDGNNPYFALVNGDFTKSMGCELSLTVLRTHRVAAQFNYVLQSARGTGSSPVSNLGAWYNTNTYQVPLYATPLDFNQAQRGSILLDYRLGKDEGGDILGGCGLNLLMTFNSGHSFTVLTEPLRGPSPSDPRFNIPAEPLGASTTPWFFQLDGRIDKIFSWGPVGLDVYVYAINILGSDNPVDVFARSGDPATDGWFQTSGGQADAAANGPQYVAFYKAVNNGKNSGNWGPPRQIRFGVRLEY